MVVKINESEIGKKSITHVGRLLKDIGYLKAMSKTLVIFL
jgi:hypothetical protein